MIDLAPFKGGRRLLPASLVIGAAGLVATLIGAFFRPQQAAFSYLVAWMYWGGIAIASLLFVMILHASHARWSTVARRVLEAMALTVVLYAVLFIPVLIGMKQIFVWISPPPDLGKALLEKLAFRHWYLNVPFFVGRAIVYFALFCVFAVILFRSSVRQDATGDLAETRLQRILSGGGLPVIGLALTFAAYDWLMSPTPSWLSEIIGVYYFAGSIISSLALLIVLSAVSRRAGEFGLLMNPYHFHSMGKLLLAFVAFWAWMAYSQFMLLWIANLPSQTGFFIVRGRGGWVVLSAMIAAGQFFLPFFALLSRDLKRNSMTLAAVGVWNLAIHYFDIYWILMPVLHEKAPAPSWMDLTAFLGLGGVGFAFGVWALRGRYAVPIRDPYLEASLRYAK